MRNCLSLLMIWKRAAANAAFLTAFICTSAIAADKPQTPRPPFPYDVETVSVSTDAGVNLGGALTIPKGKGPHPLVVLLSVAGPNDRDQTFAGHAGFHVLADYLTRNGVATARFDDRGVGSSSGDYFNASYEDLRNDALAVASRLKADPRIDPDRIGLAGMSEGGAIAGLAASQSDDIAFAILLSAPGLKGEEALKLQLENMLALSGVSGKEAEQYRHMFSEFIDIVKSDPDAPETRERMRSFLEGPGKALIPPYQFLPEDTEARVDLFLGSWYRSNVMFDPVDAYGSLDIPVLAVGGSLDPIAPPARHLANIERILQSAPADDVAVVTIEGLNHLMQEAQTGLPGEYADLENSFSCEAQKVIGDWIGDRLNG